MLYDVDQAAIKLNVSKQSIYNKIKLKMFKDKIVKKQGKIYLDDGLLNLIKDSFKFNTNFKEELKPKDIEKGLKQDITIANEDLLNLNKELINTLLEQLKIKDMQIQEKDIQINELIKLNENSQVLLKDKSHQDIKLLEDHFQQLDNKLAQIKNKMQMRKEEQIQKDEKKSWLRKMFLKD